MAHLFSVRAIQGYGDTWTVTLSTSTFQGTESLKATISTGTTATALLSITPTWTSGQMTGAYGKIDVALTAIQTSALSPGYYILTVGIADGTAPLSYGLLEVISASGGTPTQDFLVSPSEVLGLVPDVASPDNLADLPRVIGAATQAIRTYCRCNFTRATWTREYTPSYTGQVRLEEIPVNEVIRISTSRDAALFILGPSSAQIANVRYSFTGDWSSGITATGLILTSITNAVTTTNTLLFSAYPTLTMLAGAINALGWSTRITSGYAYWPSSELVGGNSAQGALVGEGAQLDVYSEDAGLERLDPETGMVWLPYKTGSATTDNPSWGPDWPQFVTPSRFPSRVRVTYDAGYDSIPSPVVMACIETAQAIFSRLATDQIIQSEAAGSYSYTLRDQLDFIPASAKHALATYRTYNA